MGGAWRPLIVDADGRIAAVIAALAAALGPPAELAAAADRAILHGYLGIDDGGAALTAAVTALAEGGHGAGLSGGTTRVGWAVAHLAGGDDAEEVCAAVDRHVARAIRDPAGAVDLARGLVGFGVYALERGQDALAGAVLEQLEQRAPPGDVEVVALLARFLAAGIAPARTRALLDAAVGQLGSCAHDLGLAAVLVRVGAAEGVEVARACTAGRGTIGAAHALNRLWQATGDDALAVTARGWIEDAVARDAWERDARLLTGAAGVALALHAAISDDEPLWDRLLLLDLAPA